MWGARGFGVILTAAGERARRGRRRSEWRGDGPIEDGSRNGDPKPVLTIGHSNHPEERFAGLIRHHGVELFVDTRSQPYSRHAPHFSAGAIEALLRDAGVAYLFLGRELGGRPASEEFYDDAGRVDYALVERSSPFLGGIHRLEREIRTRRVALLCSEEDPAGCHRRLLVGSVLSRRGYTLLHIRGDGGVQREDETDGQPVLFSQAEVSPRKSIRSVSQRRRPPSSSGR